MDWSQIFWGNKTSAVITNTQIHDTLEKVLIDNGLHNDNILRKQKLYNPDKKSIYKMFWMDFVHVDTLGNYKYVIRLDCSDNYGLKTPLSSRMCMLDLRNYCAEIHKEIWCMYICKCPIIKIHFEDRDKVYQIFNSIIKQNNKTIPRVIYSRSPYYVPNTKCEINNLNNINWKEQIQKENVLWMFEVNFKIIVKYHTKKILTINQAFLEKKYDCDLHKYEDLFKLSMNDIFFLGRKNDDLKYDLYVSTLKPERKKRKRKRKIKKNVLQVWDEVIPNDSWGEHKDNIED